jgi:hypothetical protein
MVSKQNGLEETCEGKFYQITDNSQIDTLGLAYWDSALFY